MNHYVYRCWAADGALLYIGLTSNLAKRRREHLYGASSWAHEVVRVRLEVHSTREAAAAAEKQAIFTERPMFNSQHRGSGSTWTKAEFYGDWISYVKGYINRDQRMLQLHERYREKFGGDLLELTRAEAVAQYQQPVAAEAA